MCLRVVVGRFFWAAWCASQSKPNEDEAALLYIAREYFANHPDPTDPQQQPHPPLPSKRARLEWIMSYACGWHIVFSTPFLSGYRIHLGRAIRQSYIRRQKSHCKFFKRNATKEKKRVLPFFSPVANRPKTHKVGIVKKLESYQSFCVSKTLSSHSIKNHSRRDTCFSVSLSFLLPLSHKLNPAQIIVHQIHSNKFSRGMTTLPMLLFFQTAPIFAAKLNAQHQLYCCIEPNTPNQQSINPS